MRPLALLREAFVTARAARTYSVLFGLISFAVVTAVVVLVGQAQSQRANVLETFDRPEFRTVVLTDVDGTGAVPWSLAASAASFDAVTQSWVLGPAFDVRNSSFLAGERASATMVAAEWDRLPVTLDSGRWPSGPGESIIDRASAQRLGIDATGGAIESDWGAQWAVVGVYTRAHDAAPGGVLTPFDGATVPRSLTVTVRDLPSVGVTADALVALSQATGPGQVAVDRADDAALLQSEVTGTVARHGRSIVVTSMAAAIVVLSFLSVLMVHSRRQEFGRRRALGATRAALTALVVLQGAIVVIAATAVALVVGTLVSTLRYDYAAPVSFLVLLGITSAVGAAVAQIPSAIAAGLRDPVRVLRTP